MRVSVMVPTYKDIKALELILNALKCQTYENFEVIIAEDNNDDETKKFINTYSSDLSIQHISQEDVGNRKARILNKSLSKITGEYVIFIDGDCIPYTNFIESHILLCSSKTVLCGRRVNLGDKVSQDLRKNNITSLELEKHYIKYFKYLISDNSRHLEQGLRFRPLSLLYKLIRSRDKNIHIVGSNFSCFKEDLFLINGFDEDITGGSKDDVDLEWRFVMAGLELKSCKFCANLFHLNHPRNSRVDDENIARNEIKKNKLSQKYIAQNGILKYV